MKLTHINLTCHVWKNRYVLWVTLNISVLPVSRPQSCKRLWKELKLQVAKQVANLLAKKAKRFKEFL